MKSVIVGGLLTICLAIGGTSKAETSVPSKKKSKKLVAMAQTNTSAPLKKTKKKTKVKSIHVAQATQSPTHQDELPSKPEPVFVAPTQSTGTVSVPTAQVVKEAKKNPFGFKYVSYNAMTLSTIENQSNKPDNEVRAWDRFFLGYNFNEHTSFNIMPQLMHTWFGDPDRAQSDGIANLTQPYAAWLGNTGLIFSNSKLATLAGGWVWDGLLRYDLPTSEISQKAQEYGEAWIGTGLSKKFGRFEIHPNVTLRYYLQQYNTSTAVNTQGLPLQNMNYRVYSLLDMNFSLTKKLSVALETGFWNAANHADPTTGRDVVYTDQFILNPEVDYTFNDHFSLGIGYWETPNMRNLSQTYVPFQASNDKIGDSEIYLISSLSI